MTKISILEIAGWQESVLGQRMPTAKRAIRLTSRVRVYLPVVLERMAPEEDRQQNSDPCRPDENKPGIYAILKAEAVL